jgi:hypothetical protein
MALMTATALLLSLSPSAFPKNKPSEKQKASQKLAIPSKKRTSELTKKLL